MEQILILIMLNQIPVSIADQRFLVYLSYGSYSIFIKNLEYTSL